MPVSQAPKVELISQRVAAGVSPAKAILEAVGKLDGQQVAGDLVLVGTYIRSEKYKNTNIILPKEYVGEDEYQSKVGLVLKVGPIANADWEAPEEQGHLADIGAWIVYSIKDGWPITLNGAPCRLIPYEKIRMRVSDPALIY